MISKLKLCCLVTGLIVFLAMEAKANGSPTPTATNSSTSSASSTSGSSATADQRQKQQQAQAQQNRQDQQSSTGDMNSASSDKSLFLALPAPVFTPPMAAVQCPVGVEITTEAAAAFWNGFSKASGHTDNADCVVIHLTNSLIEQCQYFSAKQAQDLHLQKKLPGFAPSKNPYLDLTPQECASVKRLALLPPPTPQTTVMYLPLPEVKLPTPPKPAAKRISGACRPAAANSCGPKT